MKVFENPTLTIDIDFGCYDEDDVDDLEENLWPVHLANLNLGERFNFSLTGKVLPPALKVLMFGSEFERPLNHLFFPQTLHTLCLGGRFNFPIAHWFKDLPNLTELMLSGEFNRSLHDHPLPPRLKLLSVGPSFEVHYLPKVWPETMKSLYLNFTLTKPLKTDMLPSTLETLECSGKHPHLLEGFPDSLLELTLYSHGYIPYQPIRLSKSIRKVTIHGGLCVVSPQAQSLKTLIYDGVRTARYCDISVPFGVETLDLGDASCMPQSLPSSLKVLTLGSNFTRSVLNNELKYLHNLEVLRFGTRFNGPVEDLVIPHSRQTLSFGKHFKQPIHSLQVPATLRLLELDAVDYPRDSSKLPLTLPPACKVRVCEVWLVQ